MNNNYEIVSNIEKLKNGHATRFLDLKLQLELKKYLKKNEYFEYLTYKDSEKIIFYTETKPDVNLLEIIPMIKNKKLEHREILGTIFSLGLKDSMFGDIIITDNKYYVFILPEIKEFLKNNLVVINKIKVSLEERDLDTLKDYERQYQSIELIVSSERIDTIIANLIKTNRNKIKDLVKSKNIILNYEVLSNFSKKFQHGDIFSIKGFGKYKYNGIIKETKSGNLVVKIDKYI